jgi:hypothetical protein
MAQSKTPKKKAVGRPKSRPADYHQHSVWLPDALRYEVKLALLRRAGKDYPFGKLVEHLLRDWLDEGAKLKKGWWGTHPGTMQP